VNCYILTGGRSTRMGRPKAELFLDRVARAAGPVFEKLFAVQRHGAETLSIPTIFEGPHRGEAPLFGVIAALEHAGSPSFILATAYAYMTADALRRLRERFESSRSALVVPVFQGIPQVLCAGYSADLVPLLLKRAVEGKLDLQSLLGEVNAEVIPVTGDVWINVNTPADLREGERER
jgi:molybdopterin-guanine dinucleotide biosynthesis protein A